MADYSAGMRKKVHLACAMVHSPSILVLDEPFEAVDPISAQTIQAILRDYAAAGGTVVISSHVMATVRACVTTWPLSMPAESSLRGRRSSRRRGRPRAALHQLVGAQVRTEAVMVATLIKLKWRLTLNALTKNVWAIVGTVLGVLYGLGALAMVLAGSSGWG